MLASTAVSLWSLFYTGYRGYYAAGGTWFLPGRPADPAQFRLINAAAVIILVVAAVTPFAILPLWQRRGVVWRAALGLCWTVAVGCVMHALINATQRILSLPGLLHIEYRASVWASINTRTTDLQDLLFNEPWFLLEGLGFADSPGSRWAPGLTGAGGPAPRPRRRSASPSSACSQRSGSSASSSSSDADSPGRGRSSFA
ncbi:hypothetical protein GA0070624_1301 [Micromonospora rhizosphaerae]|uniref:Uncharacterized protein n=1 Tax=Micromonospora rhizosphaerae TaxID=568872 RepID=A0A1C6RKC6_9ACTN|nr:hypothetical protein [Micromonospora rhizosphaerae]SCL17475.1 hypothetical protein GA0070624_1301 [Micromonospora rhizosphaerae]